MAYYRLLVDYLRWRLSLLSLSLYAIFYATASNLSSFPFLSLKDIALPGQPNLAVRVMTLERLVADLQERLAQLET